MNSSLLFVELRLVGNIDKNAKRNLDVFRVTPSLILGEQKKNIILFENLEILSVHGFTEKTVS